MPRFIINKKAQPNGDHEVHNLDAVPSCGHLPDPVNQHDLGVHPLCQSAVAYAKRTTNYSRINGCFYCAKACHTT